MHPLIRQVVTSTLPAVPEIKPGYTVRISQKVKEGDKERVQAFEGLVIKVSPGFGPEKTITVRKIVEGIGVEKIVPVYSSTITKIEVKKKAEVRRAKLYYMRNLTGKAARLKESLVSDQERAEEQAKMDAMIQEAVKAEEARKKAEEAAAEVVEAPTDEAPTEAAAEATPEVTETPATEEAAPAEEAK